MLSQTANPYRFISQAQQIIAQIPSCLAQWGLMPQFKRWRLVQDSETGMVALFGVLDNQFITRYTTTLLDDYFDPRLLHSLTTELNVQVIGSSNDGLRYTFVLGRGQPDFPIDIEEGHTSMHQRLDQFLQTTGAMDALQDTPNRSLPDVLFMDEAEFNQQMAEHEANHAPHQNLQRCVI
jgi:hypothetical protein